MSIVNPPKKIIFIFACLLFLFLWGGCSKSKEADTEIIETPVESTTPDPEESDHSPSVLLKETTFQAMDGTFKDWEMTAKKVSYNSEKEISTAEEVEVRFFDKDKGQVLRLTAKGAEMDMKTNSIRFVGEVEAESSTGEKLVVKKLHWDSKERKLIGEENVSITRKNSIMTAERMEADPSLKRVNLSGNVKVLYPDGDDLLEF